MGLGFKIDAGHEMSRGHRSFHIRLVPLPRSQHGQTSFSLLLPDEILIFFSPICWRKMERRRSGERKLGKREFREVDDARLRLCNRG